MGGSGHVTRSGGEARVLVATACHLQRQRLEQALEGTQAGRSSTSLLRPLAPTGPCPLGLLPGWTLTALMLTDPGARMLRRTGREAAGRWMVRDAEHSG